jgi:hypothetical protein
MFSNLGGVVDVFLVQGVGALGDLLGRTREALAEVDETHTNRRHGRARLVFDPTLEFVTAQDWEGLESFLAGLEPSELKRLKHVVQEKHDEVKVAGGASATLRVTRLIDAELKRRPSALTLRKRGSGSA